MNTSAKPNILLLHVDQLRFDCIGACGNRDIQTPHIDALAKDGVLYSNSFSTFPVCTPSRYSLLTGLYAHQHLGIDNHSTIPAGLDTFPKVLKNAGYRTKAVGKMHFTPTYLDVGFDEMILAEQDGRGRYDDDYHRFLKEKGLMDRTDLVDQVKEYRDGASKEYWSEFGAIASELEEKNYSTNWIGEQAMETINRWGDGGDFLMVGFIKPHHPFDPPASWSNKYDPEQLKLLPGWTQECLPRDISMHKGYFPHTNLSEQKMKKIMSYYYASISMIDHQIGRVVELLKKKGIYEDTLIIFTSDHGDYMGFHHLILKNNYMYDPVIKVPLIIKYPEGKSAGSVVDALTSNIDVAVTVINQAGCPAGKHMQGIDLSKVISGRELVFAERAHGQEYMVRSGEFKLLLCRDRDQSQFFDLAKDSMELTNLFGRSEYKQKVEEYTAYLTDWILFSSQAEVHLDENAPLVKGKNVPCREDGHREKMKKYFSEKMKSSIYK